MREQRDSFLYNERQVDVWTDSVTSMVEFWVDGVKRFEMAIMAEVMNMPSDIYDAIDRWGGCSFTVRGLMFYIFNATGKILYSKKVNQAQANFLSSVMDGLRPCRETTHLLMRIRRG